jgi:hypothetical protein
LSAESSPTPSPSLAGNFDDLTALHELPVSIEPWADPLVLSSVSADLTGLETRCEKGFVLFEGKCLLETEVQEKKDQAALEAIQTASSTDTQAEAQVKLVEQQTKQVAKAEEDLDEIIKVLEAKKTKRDLVLISTSEREL